MPSFQDSAVLVILALLLFGPKKLPVLARQLGKLMADFRRASNEFRTQMEEELRISEQADRQKQIAAIEASAPPTPAIESTPEAEQPPSEPSIASAIESDPCQQDYSGDAPVEIESESAPGPPLASAPEPAPAPHPIATSGELSILPPSTGFPIANSAPADVPAITAAPAHETELETETLHG